MTTQRISSPTKEDRIANAKITQVPIINYLTIYNNCLKEVNGWLLWALEDIIIASRDGISFADTGFIGTGEKIYDFAYGDGHYVAVGEGGLILSSTGPDDDGNWNWEIEDPPGEFSGTYFCATYTEGFFLIGGGTNEDPSLSVPTIHRSANAIAWFTCTITLSFADNGFIMDIEPGGGNILAVGTGYDSGGADIVRLALLSTAPDEDFEEDAVTLPAITLPGGSTLDETTLFRALYVEDRFLITGVFAADFGVEGDRTYLLLYYATTGAEFEDISDRLSFDNSEGSSPPPYASPPFPPALPNMVQHGNDFLVIHPNSILEIAPIGENGPDNFREITFEKMSPKSIAVLGDNFFFLPVVGFARSDPYIPLPPPPA